MVVLGSGLRPTSLFPGAGEERENEVVTMTAERSQERSSGRRSSAQVTAAAKPIAERVAADSGLVLWSVGFLRVAGRETLRVAVDRVGGIGSDELATFADRLSREIDAADVVPGERTYILETTSPGAERKLERPDQFRVCVGRQAKVVMKDGRTLEGEIAGVSERAVEVATGDETARALFDDISDARLVVKI
jgi:ribosome maturation factor RimP